MACSVKFHRNRKTVGCTIGLHPGLFIGAYGRDAAEALHAAAHVASEMDAVLKRNPELAAIVPPQATAAFRAISIASRAVKSGMTMDEVADRTGVATARVVKRLLSSIF